MSSTAIYKMSGAGNDFVVLDGRGVDVSEFRLPERIRELCTEYRTDGLMILGVSDSADFQMEFYNPDGSGGMMCGNGGRCIVAFADWLGISPSTPDHYTFLAPDGIHIADILSRPLGGRRLPPEGLSTPGQGQGEGPIKDGRGRSERSERSPEGDSHSATWTVRLQMIDVNGVQEMLGGYFLNTGTRHFVKFVDDVDAIDIEKEGKALRWNEAFAPEGANINFVQVCEDRLKIRTFEKGVEGETLACGTGITASALAAYADAKHSDGQCRDRRPLEGHGTALCPSRSASVGIRIQAKSGDVLTVDFEASDPGTFRNIHLTGPAEFA